LDEGEMKRKNERQDENQEKEGKMEDRDEKTIEMK